MRLHKTVLFLSALIHSLILCAQPAPSGTLPIVCISTENAEPIVEKDKKLNASLFITVPPESGFEALGSESEPVELTVKGRGNSTWKESEKKPYKLKFKTKTGVLGMPESRDFALLAHDIGNCTWLAALAGFQLARIVELGWVPRCEPVELMLNGEYRGCYFLTETIRIEENRLDIRKQDDLNEDNATIPYGWLIELDNYPDEYQITLNEGTDRMLRVTHKAPEELSDAQRNWLKEEFTRIDESIKACDGSWTKYIDAESLAKYAVVRETLCDVDGYAGSWYFHKDSEEEKWTAGPIWDLSIYDVKTDWVPFQLPDWGKSVWIKELMKTDEFREAFNRVWDSVYPKKINTLYSYVTETANYCYDADFANYLRWPDTHTSDTGEKASYIRYLLACNIDWIESNRHNMKEASANEIAGAENIFFLKGRMLYNISGKSLDIMILSTDGTIQKRFSAAPGDAADLSALPTGIHIVASDGKAARIILR